MTFGYLQIHKTQIHRKYIHTYIDGAVECRVADSVIMFESDMGFALV